MFCLRYHIPNYFSTHPVFFPNGLLFVFVFLQLVTVQNYILSIWSFGPNIKYFCYLFFIPSPNFSD